MQQVEFDKFADKYIELHKKNVQISGEFPEFFAEYKIKDVLGLTQEYKLEPKQIMDFGCGIGSSIPHFRNFFPNASLTCVDISEKSLSIARSKFNNAAEFHLFDGHKFPFQNQSFDIIFAACVFHHIPQDEHSALLKEWHRVLKHNGIAIIFEHNPLNPLTVHAVNTCPFDENAVLIRGTKLKKRLLEAEFSQARLRYRLFFPKFFAKLRPLEKWLKNFPLGAQYVAYAIKNKK